MVFQLLAVVDFNIALNVGIHLSSLQWKNEIERVINLIHSTSQLYRQYQVMQPQSHFPTIKIWEENWYSIDIYFSQVNHMDNLSQATKKIFH